MQRLKFARLFWTPLPHKNVPLLYKYVFLILLNEQNSEFETIGVGIINFVYVLSLNFHIFRMNFDSRFCRMCIPKYFMTLLHSWEFAHSHTQLILLQLMSFILTWFKTKADKFVLEILGDKQLHHTICLWINLASHTNLAGWSSG